MDVLFIAYYVDQNRWHNDTDQPTDHAPPAPDTAPRDEVDLLIDGKPHDFSRFLSLVRYGTTNEHDRYDPFNMTLLSGSYFLNLLDRAGYGVRVANATDADTLQRLGQRYAPRFVMLSTTLLLESAERGTIPMAVRQIRQQWPDAVIVLGGLLLVHYKNTYARAWLENLLHYYGADVYIVSPQSESPVLEVLSRGSLQALAEGPPIPETYIRYNGSIIGPSDAPEQTVDMASCTIDWSKLPQTDHLYHTVHMRTARSCAFKCAFCEYPVSQGPLTLAPLAAVEHELQELKRLGTVTSIIFTDDTWTPPKTS